MKTQLFKLRKFTSILMKIETYLNSAAGAFLPDHRTKLIDICTLFISEYEDDFFTYDALKNIVANMVQRHQTGDTTWTIDIDHSTSEQVTLFNQRNKERIKVPVNLFFSTVFVQTPGIH